MRNKLFITHGTLSLALAASVFIGCQDFLGGDKGNQPAAPSGDNQQHVAQALSPQDSADELPAPAVDTPLKTTIPPAAPAVDTPPQATIPPAAQPASPPEGTALTPQQQECLDAYNVMQSGNGDYSKAKDLYAGKGCNEVLNAVQPNPRPYTPLTIEEECKMYRKNVITLPTTGDPKYDAYMAQEAIKCVDYP
jgi:hypothetical protein